MLFSRISSCGAAADFRVERPRVVRGSCAGAVGVEEPAVAGRAVGSVVVCVVFIENRSKNEVGWFEALAGYRRGRRTFSGIMEVTLRWRSFGKMRILSEMPNRLAHTSKFQLQLPEAAVNEAKSVAPLCGLQTANQLAVELVVAGLALLRDPETPPAIPRRLLELRAALRGQPLEQPDTSVRAMIREELAALLAERAFPPGAPGAAVPAPVPEGQQTAPGGRGRRE